ncbi:unannotated protein [freshwater metagenome]|uniref:Unannotated protein n=1 Tax=freshwater metagenome TaxID=449393 RepID=A0A6J6GFS6_9ZZZZ
MNRPATIEGTALMASTTVRSGLAKRPFTSLRYTAVVMPRGTAMRLAIPTCWMVPMMA